MNDDQSIQSDQVIAGSVVQQATQPQMQTPVQEPVAPPVQDISQTSTQTAASADDLVAEASAIQDLFAQNDVSVPQQGVDESNTLSKSDLGSPVGQGAASNSDPNQKSPLDILEEILNKEEKKTAKEQPAVDEGPSPEELARIQQLQEQEKQLIDEQRQKMQAEMNSDEQKQRDQIRQQQIDAHASNNPYEIVQLERKKITR